METIRWFTTLRKEDVLIGGGKGANLGELTAAGVPVPPGFVVTSDAFNGFLRQSGLRDQILASLRNLDVNDTAALDGVAAELQRAVLAAEVPRQTVEEIHHAYRELSQSSGVGEEFVAVRSSATAEDRPHTSFAGMNETFLNVRGADAVVEAVRRCWASLYGARVIFYRREQGLAEEGMSIAVAVQKMINSEKAGVLFTENPATGDESVLVIESSFGLGDAVVSGSVQPDYFEVRKKDLAILQRRIAHKSFADLRSESGENIRRELSDAEAEAPSLTDEEVRAIAQLGLRIGEHYGTPQDVEWAIEGGQVYIVQSRPVTATGKAATSAEEETAPGDGILVRGLGASPGIAVGRARVLASATEGARVQEGDILVTRMTAPDWAPVMRRAAAIITDEGGMTAHAAIVSRELGIPCIVGVGNATEKIPDGEIVTVDARQGIVYRGKRAETAAQQPRATAATVTAAPPVTATRLLVNLGEPDLAAEVAARPVDGVGLLRLEFLVLSVTNNVHPRRLLEQGRGDEYRQKLAEGLRTFAAAFAPRPIICRSTDFRTNEYRGMEGGEAFEPREANPMIGYRGAFRYVAEPDLFRLELAAVRDVREKERLTNLHLMVPFVRTLGEFRRCKELIDDSGLTRDPAFQLWVMAEVPSILYRLADYAALGTYGVSIGSNDLTQLMLGVDRDSERLAPLFDERDDAVMGAIRDLIEGAHRVGMRCSICGQAPSVYPEVTERLVEWGIDSISVNPDAIDATRRIIASAEQRLLIAAARRVNPGAHPSDG
ncbi:MAG TPA: phosphoenolpyruvate synthase [Armatimonadota bacterium]|nr:phosphoenolpyruvate synthase [Armatimonadota bacterium]